MFIVSPKLAEYIKQAEVITGEKIDASDKSIDKDDALDKGEKNIQLISHAQLVQVYQSTKPCDSLLHFIRMTNAKLYVPSPQKKDNPKSKEYIQLMDKLRQREREEEYQRLVNPSPQHTTLYEQRLSEAEKTPAQENKELKSHITTIFNIFISVGSVMYAIWYWTNSSWRLAVGQRVLMALFFGLVVLVAEVVVYLGYLNKIEEARIKERTKTEKKTVLRRIDIEETLNREKKTLKKRSGRDTGIAKVH